MDHPNIILKINKIQQYTGLNVTNDHEYLLPVKNSYTSLNNNFPLLLLPTVSGGSINVNMGMNICLPICIHFVRYRVPEFPHSSATFNIILGSRILTSPKVLQGSLGNSACPMQCSQPCPVPGNRDLTGLTWFPHCP